MWIRVPSPGVATLHGSMRGMVRLELWSWPRRHPMVVKEFLGHSSITLDPGDVLPRRALGPRRGGRSDAGDLRAERSGWQPLRSPQPIDRGPGAPPRPSPLRYPRCVTVVHADGHVTVRIVGQRAANGLSGTSAEALDSAACRVWGAELESARGFGHGGVVMGRGRLSTPGAGPTRRRGQALRRARHRIDGQDARGAPKRRGEKDRPSPRSAPQSALPHC
jgi:hypothetical protein